MLFQPLDALDSALNGITMYRLVLYALIGLLVAAGILGFVGLLPFGPIALLISVAFVTAMCVAANTVFSYVFDAPTNTESVYITALILALIITPAASPGDFAFLGWAAILSMASKYVAAIRNKLVFNPAAVAVALTALFAGHTASWWVGTGIMLPFVAVAGSLIVRKVRHGDLVAAFFASALVLIIGGGIGRGSDITMLVRNAILDSPLVFFATVMLTEPLTTPPTGRLRMLYGAVVGILYWPSLRIAGVSSTPELALSAGNILSWVLSPKYRDVLSLKHKLRIAPDVYDFIFAGRSPLRFVPGQYMEWTLPHEHPDDRGNRRYFTIASSPTERDIRVGIKVYPHPSSYKRSMERLREGSSIVASQLAGDFVLPADASVPLAFIAGGIGITPFRSMVKYLTDTGDARNAVLIYANRTEDEIVYGDVFDEAERAIGLKTVYTLTDLTWIPKHWNGETGRIDAPMITRHVPDYRDRLWYVSGTHAMTVAMEQVLQGMGVPRSRIRTDYFPGF